MRTDLNLSDTGQLQVSGTWQRAQTFRDTPMQFSMEWSRAQLGQLTKFVTGNDKGWRGYRLQSGGGGNACKAADQRQRFDRGFPAL